MPRIFDHVDLRVRNLREAARFYSALLPELGFRQRVDIEGWLQFENAAAEPGEFFGITEFASHQPNQCRIAFWAESIERVNQLAAFIAAIGGKNIEGPGFEADDYYAVYFEDPSGNFLEVCHRSRGFAGNLA